MYVKFSCLTIFFHKSISYSKFKLVIHSSLLQRSSISHLETFGSVQHESFCCITFTTRSEEEFKKISLESEGPPFFFLFGKLINGQFCHQGFLIIDKLRFSSDEFEFENILFEINYDAILLETRFLSKQQFIFV